MATLRTPTVRVLFDEAHQQAWTTRPEVAEQMLPGHPGDSSYEKAANALSARDFVVKAHTEGHLCDATLAGVDVLVLPHLSEPKYEATTGVGVAHYSPDEVATIARFVTRGGGLVVLAESEQDKYGNNLDEIAGQFGITIEHTSLQDYSSYHQAPSWINVQPNPSLKPRRGSSPLLSQVSSSVFYRSGSLSVADSTAEALLVASETATHPGAVVMAANTHGKGRVVVFADSDLFGDDCLDDFNHRQLWLNTMYYVALPAFAADARTTVSDITTHRAWAELKEATSTLRQMQQPDGSLGAATADLQKAANLVTRMSKAIGTLRPDFPSDADYLDAVVADLAAWTSDGYGKPNFGHSLSLFRPEQHRKDGIEHLIVFPMYTPNGSLDTRFEALIVRVPWPLWIEQLEANSFDNAKFVPVHLVDSTEGYDSECAVLFPETVSVDGPAANYFGGIFCDREAERYRRIVGAAVESTNLPLPPDVAALITSEPMTQDMFELWDLIHDRAHSHGELPFDPFMIRQRLPFWMYSLEELRCDLTAFHQSDELADTFPFARYVQLGVLFDRLFRFPITGSRVRNYDGLAGQLLFGFLHSRSILTWKDNALSIDWANLPAAVNDLRLEIEDLYRAGIGSTKVRYWIAAHDLVAKYVQPNLASTWTPESRAGRDEDDHRAWVTMVHADEFPLSMFYQSLQQKLSPLVERKLAA